MTATDPFATSGRWYRACLHAHTTNSDGQMSPESLVRHYRIAGFDVLAITDHRHVTDASDRSTDDFLVLPGIEYNLHGPEAGRYRSFHIVGVGVTTNATEKNDLQAFVDAIHADNGIAILAHPSWSGLEGADLLAVKGADAVEVWNAGSELETGRGDSSPQWDAALARGAVLGGVAADDSHFPGFDTARSWVALRLHELTTDAVIAALRSRCYYSSCGPVIHAIEAEGETIRVACSRARAIHVLGPPTAAAGLVAGTMGLAHHARRLRQEDAWAEGTLDGDGLTGGLFHLPPTAAWARVVVEDRQGRRAWSNPLWRTGGGWAPEPGAT